MVMSLYAANMVSLIFLILPLFAFGTQGKEGIREFSLPDDCSSVNISCMCGNGETLEYLLLELNSFAANVSENGTVECSGFPDPHEACANISCSLDKNNTGLMEKRKAFNATVSPGMFGQRKKIESTAIEDNSSVSGGEFTSSIYPPAFNIIKEDISHLRSPRLVNPCKVTPLDTALITCKEWQNLMICYVTCIHGYALESYGEIITSTTLHCKMNDNKWEPHGFKECAPYMSCNVRLISPGSLKCSQPSIEPLFCDISCQEYDDNSAITNQRFTCFNETFEDSLPHCAKVAPIGELIGTPVDII